MRKATLTVPVVPALCKFQTPLTLNSINIAIFLFQMKNKLLALVFLLEIALEIYEEECHLQCYSQLNITYSKYCRQEVIRLVLPFSHVQRMTPDSPRYGGEGEVILSLVFCCCVHTATA